MPLDCQDSCRVQLVLSLTYSLAYGFRTGSPVYADRMDDEPTGTGQDQKA